MSLSSLKFAFNGVSCDAHGVEALRLPPPVRPALREETVTIPGRSGSLHIRDGSYETSLVACDCYLPYEQGRPVSGIAQICAWLTGSGWWTQSDRPGRRFRVSITDELSFQPVVPGFADRLFSIPLWMEPYAYHTDNSPIAMTAAGRIANPGTAEAEPLITIEGSGDINLQVGMRTVLVTGLTGGSITLDCAARMAYRGGAGLNGIVTIPGAGWPVLGTGTTAVTWWGGSVTRVTVTPNWRDI